jgi:hypothetical protein
MPASLNLNFQEERNPYQKLFCEFESARFTAPLDPNSFVVVQRATSFQQQCTVTVIDRVGQTDFLESHWSFIYFRRVWDILGARNTLFH